MTDSIEQSSLFRTLIGCTRMKVFPKTNHISNMTVFVVFWEKVHYYIESYNCARTDWFQPNNMNSIGYYNCSWISL